MKKIVVLDGYTLNPGDLDWDGLRALGDVTVYDRTAEADVVDRAADAEIVLTNKSIISAAAIAALPSLKYIGVLATGYNVVDVAAAQAQQIVVTNVPAYGTATVAQFTFALILEWCHRVGLHSDSVRAGDWSRQPDFSYSKAPMMDLSGKVLAVIGMGNIGTAVAAIGQAFGMEVIGYRRHPEKGGIAGVRFEDLATCFEQADFVSLHCPLTASNKEFVNRSLLSRMKRSAYLINTSRGPLIREQDLAEVLNEGGIAGAALDVLSVEPPGADHPLIGARNCLITPHIAWATREARGRLLTTAVSNVQGFLEGKLCNVVGGV